MNSLKNCYVEVDAVITSFNQKTMISEAVASLKSQTIKPKRIIIVDDGSTDQESLDVLHSIENDNDLGISIRIIYQENAGVSTARNTGIRNTEAPMVLILDGDDKIESTYIECVSKLLYEHPTMVAASSWMKTFGVLDAVVRPSGGNIVSFLSHNCCPATHIFRRKVFEKCGGYDESMRSGYEDWDFFLSILESEKGSCIGIVNETLLQYRTTSASSNIKSMTKRLELMKYIIEKHKESYYENFVDVLLEIEFISNTRLYMFEDEIIHSISNKQEISDKSKEFLKEPTYGDGGMASAVRIASNIKNTHKCFT